MKYRHIGLIAAVALAVSLANVSAETPQSGESTPLPKARPSSEAPPFPDAKPAAPAAIPVPSDRPEVEAEPTEAAPNTPLEPTVSPPELKKKSPLFADDAMSPACQAIEEGRVSGRPLKPIEDPAGCVVPEVYAVSSVGTERLVKLSPEAKMNCAMVDRLDRFVEDIIEPAAQEYLQSELVGLGIAGSYVCRRRNGQANAKPSEHGKANAIDIARFILADDRVISVEGGWILAVEPEVLEPEVPEPGALEPEDLKSEKKQEPANEQAEEIAKQSEALKASAEDVVDVPEPRSKPSPEAESEPASESVPEPEDAEVADETVDPEEAPEITPEEAAIDSFLRAVHEAACGPFTTVIGPDGDEYHRDHFHFDLATRGKGGQSTFCQ